MATTNTTDTPSFDQKRLNTGHTSTTITSFDPSPYNHSNSPSPTPSSHNTAVPSSKTYRLIESTRLGLTILVLILGIIILSTSADVVSVYNKTHLGGSDFLGLVPLWGGEKLDVRGEVAVLVGGAVVVAMGLVDVLVEKLYALRTIPSLHTLLSILAPLAGLITSVVATALQYHINTSNTSSTLQSWSCQWRNVAIHSPNFEMVCKESRTALYLTVLLIPLEVGVLALAAGRVVVGRKVGGVGGVERKG